MIHVLSKCNFSSSAGLLLTPQQKLVLQAAVKTCRLDRVVEHDFGRVTRRSEEVVMLVMNYIVSLVSTFSAFQSLLQTFGLRCLSM